MKKTTLVALVFGALLVSCSDNGKQVEASDAEIVETVETETTVEYKTVKEGSYFDWRASHLGGVEPRFGKLYAKTAEILVNNGAVTNASIIVDMTTLTVENFGDDAETTAKLTGHLLSPDLFNTEVYPTSKFELTSISEGTGEYNSMITGNLTILDVTKSITFNANVSVSENEVSVVSEDFAINRQDWGIIYHTEGDKDVPAEYVIANDIGFTINVSLTK
ncbi:MAG: YceI family protein [Flavobacteriales bacterium]|nr:YceI family protein [Flavobacteriales bacterium]NQX98535.1 YceI family protein [Flavobacteriales bacterium]